MIIPLRISGGSQVMPILKKDDIMTTGPGAGGRQNAAWSSRCVYYIGVQEIHCVK